MAWSAAALSVAVALLAVYAASSAPDALEAAVARLGLAGPDRPDFQAPFADYTAPIGGPWVAALLGLLIVFGIAWGSATLLAARRRP
jgi:hypothetical protein